MKRWPRWIVPIGVAALWCALILFVHRDSPRTLVSAHGLLHAAIAEEFASSATRPPLATPPENPLFAGTPLPYYYFFHAVGAQLARLLHVDVIHAFELLVLLAAATVVLLGFGLGRWIHGAPAAARSYGIAFALLFFAGCHVQAPFVLLARWWKHGSALFTSNGFAADGDYLWGLVHPVNGAMRVGDPYGTLGPLASYFFNVTARPLALASLVVVLALLAPAIGAATRNRGLALVALALAMAMCTLWSPLLGIAAAGALAAALLYVALRWHRPGGAERYFGPPIGTHESETLRRLVALERTEFRASLLAAAALVAGVLLAAPWYRHLLGGAEATITFGFNATRAIGVAASAWLLALLAFPQPRGLLAEATGFARAVKLAGLLLAIPTAFVALPVGNEDNFLHGALVCWSVLAASAVVSSLGRRAERDWSVHGDERSPMLQQGSRRRLLFLHLAFLPTLAILVFAYTGRPPVPIAFADATLARTPADGPEARLYAWIRASTPDDAVFVQDPGSEGRRCTGNASELPAFTGRALFTDYARHYLVAPNRDASRRVALAHELALGERPAADDDRYLAALRRPLFVVTYDADAATLARLATAYGAPSFEADGVRVHAWRPRE